MKTLILLTTIFSFNAFAASLKIKKSEVSWVATGYPGFLSIEGIGGKITAEHLKIEDNYLSGYFKVLVKDFKTGMDLRDQHMLNYLESETYPYAYLKIDKKPLNSQVFKGYLQIKENKKVIVGNLEIKGSKVSGSFNINLNDFPAIGAPSWRGISIADEVTIKVNADIAHD